MMRNGGVQIYFRAILVFAWKDGAQTAAQEAAERSERVRAQRRVTAEQQEQEAAEADAQRAAEEAKRLRAELQATLEEKERLRSEVAGLKQDAFEAKRRRLAADAAAQQATAEAEAQRQAAAEASASSTASAWA